MTNQKFELMVKIDTGKDADISKLEQITGQLQKEIKELDVEKVQFVKTGDEAPKGSKAVDPITLGSILVIVTSSKVLMNVINFLQAWLTSNERYSVTLEVGKEKLTVTGIESNERQKLIESWIRCHTVSETHE